MYKKSVSILDVGHGNSTVLIDSQGVIVIDAGSGSVLSEYLDEAGITHVDVVLISHADGDHIGGVVQLLAGKKVTLGMVRLNSDSLKGSEIWNDLRYELDQAHNAGTLIFEPLLVSSDKGEFDRGDVHIQVCAPGRFLMSGGRDMKGRRLSSNSISAVIRLVINDHPIALLPGDIDETGLDNLIESNANVAAPILVFPHHGGGTGSKDEAAFTARLCQLVNPDTVIFSIGRGRHGTPRPEIVNAVRQYNSKIRISCTQLSNNCCSDGHSVHPRHLLDAFSFGRQHNQCCAGTMIIPLDEWPSVLLPASQDHERFIQLAAPTALCRK